MSNEKRQFVHAMWAGVADQWTERADYLDQRSAAGAQRRQHFVAVSDQCQHHSPGNRLQRVPPQIEVISGVRSWRLELTTERSTVGKAAENDVSLTDDATASHLHAVLERFAAGWCVTDLGSSNGTWVNGERIPLFQRHPTARVYQSATPHKHTSAGADHWIGWRRGNLEPPRLTPA